MEAFGVTKAGDGGETCGNSGWSAVWRCGNDRKVSGIVGTGNGMRSRRSG